MAAKRKFEDIVSDLRDEGLDQIADELDQYSGSALRKKAEEAESVLKERDELKAKLESIEAKPKILKAFEEYGIDLEGLSPAEKAVIEDAKPGDDGPTAEWVGELAEKFSLPMREGAEGGADEAPAGEAVAAAARRAPGGERASTSLKPEDVNDWPADKLRRLMDKEPEAYEALLRGETVTGLAFS